MRERGQGLAFACFLFRTGEGHSPQDRGDPGTTVGVEDWGGSMLISGSSCSKQCCSGARWTQAPRGAPRPWTCVGAATARPGRGCVLFRKSIPEGFCGAAFV